ncbi:MAG: anti-sigma factor family protein [Sphingomonadaceae bacterium]
MNEPCPRMNGLSGYVDSVLPPVERTELETHLGACAVCGAALADLRALHATLRALAEEKLSYDIGALILGRLPARPSGGQPSRGRQLQQLVPVSLGAAAALAAGVYLGGTLIGAAGVAPAPRVAMLAVFDAVPPGAVCTGDPACYGRRK